MTVAPRGSETGAVPVANVGRMVGTPIVAAARYFESRYGRAAVGEVVSKIPARWRSMLNPHAEAFGLLGARWYSYDFIQDWVTTARSVVRLDEDTFIREIAYAGIDGSLNTVMRAMVRWFGSPRSFAERSQESWRLFHDTGIVTVPTLTSTEVRRRITEWHGHNVVVCKIVQDVFARTFAQTGVKNVVSRREECVAWGRDACVFHIKWDDQRASSR
jgi:hypothetical protein